MQSNNLEEIEKQVEEWKRLKSIRQHFYGALLEEYWKAKMTGDTSTVERYADVYTTLECIRRNLAPQEGKKGYRKEYDEILQLMAKRFDKDNVTPEMVADTITGIEELCAKYQIKKQRKGDESRGMGD